MNRMKFIQIIVMALSVVVFAGSFTDARDGQVYRTIKIGNQTWMSQNLNYKTSRSFCYMDENSNCDSYGRLYQWRAATAACPSGWHLPSKREFQTLIDYAGGIDIAGKKLKSSREWRNGGNGEDEFGFKVKPYGNRNKDGGYVNLGTAAYFWTRDENGENGYTFFALDNYDVSDMIELGKNLSLSVRCIEGDEAAAYDEEDEEEYVVDEYEEDIFEEEDGEEVEFNYGSVTDTRDGQTYRTVLIGNQIWMADNLNFKVNDKTQSWCYENKEAYCRKYGRLYTWAAVMAKPEAKCGMGKQCSGIRNKHRGLCPENFHVPTKDEWLTLINHVGGIDYAAKELKESGVWNHSFATPNNYGFSALPAGDRLNNKEFANQGILTFFWTATESDKNHATEIFFYDAMILMVNDEKNVAFSVRCVGD